MYERELLTRLAGQHDVRLLMTGRACDLAPAAKWTVGRLPIHRGMKWWLAPFVLLDGMRDEPRPDLLRVHSLKFIGPAALVMRRTWPGIPTVAHHHHIDDGWTGIERFVSDRMDRVIVGTEFARAQMRAKGWRTDHVRVVPYGVDSDRFSSRLIPVDRPHPVVLYFGGIKPRKNLDRLLDVWARLVTDMPEALLTISGGGVLLDHYRSVVRERKIPNVSFLGYVEERDKPFIYKAADVFVFPSTLEGFGLPVLEAMASGLPCVVSDASDFRYWIDAPFSHPLNDETDVQSWVGLLTLLLRNANLRAVLGAQHRNRVKAWTWDACVEQTLKVYEEVV